MMDIKDIMEYFFQLVRINSPSGQERELAKKLVKDLHDMGFTVYEDDAGKMCGGSTGNIIARLEGSREVAPVLFAAHMDTVAKTGDIEPVVDDGKIISRGDTILSADDKAGICAIIQGIKEGIREGKRHGDIEIVFTICEEGGLKGSKSLDVSLLKAKEGFALDSSGEVGKIVTRAPAQNKLDIEITGKAAHAGIEPEKGISAIQLGAEAVYKMKLGRIDEETTANIGVIRGGEATNIVTEKLEMQGEVRSLSMEKLKGSTRLILQIIEKTAERHRGKAVCKVTPSYPAYSLDDSSGPVKRAEKAVKNIGLTPLKASSGGGSDANILNGKGIPTVNLGAGFYNAHSADEYISVQDLVNLCRLVKALL